MPLDQFMIAPFSTGLETDVKPFLVPEDAFTRLQNAYVFRGRVRKRFGSSLMGETHLNSRLRAPIYSGTAVAGGAGVGITDGAGDATSTVAGPFVVGQMFSIGNASFAINDITAGPHAMTQFGAGATLATFNITTSTFVFTGAPATEQIYWHDLSASATTDGAGALYAICPGIKWNVGAALLINKAGAVLPEVENEMFTVITAGNNQDMLTTGPSTTVKFSTDTGIVEIAGAAINASVYFYPSDPVMGLITYEGLLTNDEPVYAFDTQFAYQYLASGWLRLGSAVWTGGNSQFFWGTNWRGSADNDYILFVSNFNAVDQMKYWNGTTWKTNFAPVTSGTNTIETAKIIIPFKNRLLLFNVIEKVIGVNIHYPARCRFSKFENPFDFDVTSEEAGWISATTKEAIISAVKIKDRIIVFFERSTWELVFTGNQEYPFRFQEINAELGVESTFSPVLFDRSILGVGNVGIHSCNGVNVQRIDDKIPDEVFNIHNGNEGVERVHGIRDYTTEMVYWTFPADNNNPSFPNRVLAYNYKNGSWSFNDDSITVFGYYQRQDDITWGDITSTWQEYADTWVSGFSQSEFRNIIAGNQQGFVFIVDPTRTRNAPALQINDITILGNIISLRIINHNLIAGDFIAIENVEGITGLDGIYEVELVNAATNLVLVEDIGIAGTYTGGGTVARVSKIDIKTKRFNFYQNQGKNLFIPKIDFYLDSTNNGEFTIDISTSASNRSLLEDGISTGAILGTNIVETRPYPSVGYEETQEQVWHSMYPQADGESIQLRMYLSNEQMIDPGIVWSDFVLNAISFYAKSLDR